MLKEILLLFLASSFLVESSAQDTCKPLWPRLEFGSVFTDWSSTEKIIIKFNTKDECPRSYVLVENDAHSIRKIYCQTSEIQGSEKMEHYKTYVQRCSVEQVEFGKKFKYNLYGSNSSSSSVSPFSNEPIEASVFDPNDEERTTSLIFVGDWGELHRKIGIYTSINQTLQKVLADNPVDGFIINGDIAYDLDSNNGQNYEEFMAIYSRLARFVPTYINTGNHEHNSLDVKLFFEGTFQQYGKDSSLVVSLNLGSFRLISFDPYEALYDVPTNKKIKKAYPKEVVHNFTSFQSLERELQKVSNSTKPTILNSHYPIFCSGDSIVCTDDLNFLKEYIKLMFAHEIKYYMGAHYHTYERVHPYCENKQFLTDSSSDRIYLGDKNCFLSIVEGIAGNDVKIIESYSQIKSPTAAVSFNETGVGLMSVDKESVVYRHYSSVNITTLRDVSTVYFNKVEGNESQSSMQLRTE